mmetsp:Transcript_62636/g.203058  ORF Transcript_62636/g.203058 Transcript_62636/m.203058 type:complete len:214 (+) Transcript_62636:293-934(+)
MRRSPSHGRGVFQADFSRRCAQPLLAAAAPMRRRCCAAASMDSSPAPHRRRSCLKVASPRTPPVQLWTKALESCRRKRCPDTWSLPIHPCSNSRYCSRLQAAGNLMRYSSRASQVIGLLAGSSTFSSATMAFWSTSVWNMASSRISSPRSSVATTTRTRTTIARTRPPCCIPCTLSWNAAAWVAWSRPCSGTGVLSVWRAGFRQRFTTTITSA